MFTLYLFKTLKIVFLSGGVLYFILSILSFFNNEELFEGMGQKFIIEKKKDTIDENDIKKKVCRAIGIELLISSIIDFILMFVFHKLINRTENNNHKFKNKSKISLDNFDNNDYLNINNSIKNEDFETIGN
jgi:uncharacterized membrane protein